MTNPQPSLDIAWHGQPLTLLHQRAVLHPASRTLIVADLHLGKADHFRAAGVPVPDAANACTLRRLTDLLNQYAPQRLIVLGDFFHARAGVTPHLLDQLQSWRQQHAKVEVINVRGNHDRHAGDPPPHLDIHSRHEPFHAPGLEPLALQHHPPVIPPSPPRPLTTQQATNESRTPVLAGHLHPAALIQAGRERLRLPCFWLQPNALILPAFGAFTGCSVIQPAPADRVFTLTETLLYELGPAPAARRHLLPKRTSFPRNTQMAKK